jgi:hypothetical protein
MTVGGLMAAGWASATQSFVVEKNGSLVHPHLWQWPFIASLVVAGAGLWVFFSTYLDWLPVFGRDRSLDHSSQYALWFVQPNSIISPDSQHAGRITWSLGLVLRNGGPNTIDIELDSSTVTINEMPQKVTPPEPRRRRVLPGHERVFGLGFVSDIATDPMPTAALRYSVIYGQPGNVARYRRTHAVRVGFMDPYDPTNPALRDNAWGGASLVTRP